MREAGSIDEAREYAKKLTSEAIELIRPALPESAAKQMLLSLAELFIDRLN